MTVYTHLYHSDRKQFILSHYDKFGIPKTKIIMCHLSFNHLWLVGRFLSPRPLQPLFDTSLVRSLETIDHTVSAVVGRTPLLHREGCSDSTQCDLHGLIYSQFALCNMPCENTVVIYCPYLYVMYWPEINKELLYCIVLIKIWGDPPKGNFCHLNFL